MSKVLIVDDDKDIAELISIILKKEGIDTYIRDDPKEVMNIASFYDLILLDIMMPSMSGTELCLKIRNKINRPILFLSAKNTITDKIVGYEVGGDDYITKPFDNTELVLKIKSYLRLNKRNFNKKESPF